MELGRDSDTGGQVVFNFRFSLQYQNLAFLIIIHKHYLI